VTGNCTTVGSSDTSADRISPDRTRIVDTAQSDETISAYPFMLMRSHERVKMMEMPFSKPTLVDLFCGAGGLSLGFKRSGFDVVFGADVNRAALETYRHNLGNHAHSCDLAQYADLPTSTVIAGGPPCQGFSSAGARRIGDDRNNLVAMFANVVAKFKPQAFVFENVEGFLTGEDGARVIDLLGPLLDAGYRIHLRKVNAANYGVPQHRKRVVAIGGLGWDPTFPKATHTAYGAPGAHLASKLLPLAPTFSEALAGLPAASQDAPGIPQGHFYKPLTGIDFERAMALEAGMTMRDLPEALHHPSYSRRANRRVMDGTPSNSRGGAPAGIRRLSSDEPCKAITGGGRSEFLHPKEHRNLTLRECARLQTFDDSFQFFGTVSEQMQLIGNAVPPRLAQQIGCALRKDLENATTVYDRGALLSYVPTLSDGTSPALKKVTDLVHRTFDTYIQSEVLKLWA
jgi:DNA (cytosine-5)-methyltransferase 1